MKINLRGENKQEYFKTDTVYQSKITYRLLGAQSRALELTHNFKTGRPRYGINSDNILKVHERIREEPHTSQSRIAQKIGVLTNFFIFKSPPAMKSKHSTSTKQK